MPAMVEIHQQESQVVQHIDARQLFGELDAIEQQRPSVDQTDIAQMQVAVTAPHLARLPALVEQPAMASQFVVETALEAIDLCRGKAGRAAIAQNADVGLGHLGHGGRAAAVKTVLGLLVKRGDMGGQRIHQRR